MSQFSLWVIDYYCLPLAKSTVDVGHAGMGKTERGMVSLRLNDSLIRLNSLINFGHNGLQLPGFKEKLLTI